MSSTICNTSFANFLLTVDTLLLNVRTYPNRRSFTNRRYPTHQADKSKAELAPRRMSDIGMELIVNIYMDIFSCKIQFLLQISLFLSISLITMSNINTVSAPISSSSQTPVGNPAIPMKYRVVKIL